MRCCLLAGLAVALAASGAMAQTYAEFKAAIQNAADGDTVWIENDLEYDSALPLITKKITIASPLGQTNVLKRAARMSSTWLSVDASAATADITLRDVIVDGNSEAGATSAMFARMKAGKLTLDAGATVRNFDWTGRGLGISAAAVVDMNEGSVIRDCRYEGWGMFLVGRVDANDNGGMLNMRGGLVTGCAGHGGTATNGYDGVLYIYYGGQINMSGGTITGNTSEKASAGVVVYNDSKGGGLFLSDTASITNNVGGLANDIWCYSSGRIYLSPDYAGRATLWNGTSTTKMADPVLDSIKTPISCLYRATGASASFSGAGNISCQGRPDVVANGYCGEESERFTWGHPTFDVGERLTCVTKQEALDKARPDEPLCPLDDFVDTTLTFTNGQNYVLSGRGVRGFRLTADTTVSTVLNLKDGATIKLVDMVVDGGGDVRPELAKNSLFSVGTNCVLTLGAGTTVRNVKTSNISAVAALVADRARLVMEDGAVITDCEDVHTAGWGFLVRAGQLEVKATYDDRPCFEMRGGLITGNKAATTGAASGGYGGMIYIQNGRFEMTGGTITGNSCGAAGSGSCAGVQVYAGKDTAGAWISGTARIVGNVGKNPDVYRSGSQIHLFGDFRGRVGISSGKQASGELADVVVEDGATGAWGLFPAATTATSGLVGKFAEGGVRWTASTGSVDGEAIATAEDALECWSVRNTAPLDEAGPAVLPHVFAGTALGIDGTLTLDFDPIAMRKDARLPIRLLTAQDGAFTGDWTFNLPAYDKPGSWEVSPVRENGDIVAYDLAFYPAGAMLIIR